MKEKTKKMFEKISSSLPDTKVLFMLIGAILIAALLYSVFMILIAR